TQVQKKDDYETDTERMEIPPGTLDESAPEDYKTDTERMETLEQRFQALEGKVNASSAPKPKEKETFPTHRITGFLQLDQVVYAQDPLNMSIVGDAQNATGFRRARFAVL